jgi:hypothetical protein|nr:MAG TPA: hypothetical protein [Caudoviricetes sp.]
MCNPTTQRPISEALPLVNALIEEAERNCIDIRTVDVFAHHSGLFTIDLIPYDGGAQALAGLLGLKATTIYTRSGNTYESTSRRVGRWLISSRRHLSAEAVAA